MANIMQRDVTCFVSNDGNDSWSGRLREPDGSGKDGPFATLGRARDALRELKRTAGGASPVRVLVRGGTYYLTEPLVFGPEDSGTHECPVIWAAYPGESPVISGGFVIDGDWSGEGGGVVSIRVEGAPYFRQLSVNGERRKRARTPNTGFFEIEKALSGTSFIYREGEMERYAALEDAEVVVIHSWNESRLRIESLDEATRTVVFRDPKAMHEIGWTGVRGVNRYYVENIREGLDESGEWYFDRKSSTLFYRPESGEDLDSAVVVAPRLRELLRFEGDLEADRFVEYLRIEGLTFSDTDWDLPADGYPDCGDVGDIVDPAMITFEAARYCEIRGNVLRNSGTYALELNGYGNRVEENEIHDTGSGGIVTRNYHPEHNLFRFNHIHHCGHNYPSGTGINIDDGGGTFANNLIHDIAHSGIYARHWATATQEIERRNQEQGLLIESNEIYDVSTVTDDSGGIFVRDSNIVIRGNFIHDNHSGQRRCPGWGIYLGCETRDTLVEDNLVYNCLESLHVWYHDRNITVTNNIFVGSEWCHINFGNPEHLSHERVRIVGNVIYCTNPREKLFKVYGERSLPLLSNNNVIFSATNCVLEDPVITGIDGVTTFEEWKSLGLDANTINANPVFENIRKGDYSLKPRSPAFRLGFRQLDFRNVGLRGRSR